MSYINVFLKERLYIGEGEDGCFDIEIEAFYSEEKTYDNLDVKPIILDEKGKDYVLTFCYVERGSGIFVADAVYDYHFIFKINEKQAKILKTLDGYLGKGVNIHYLDINFKKGTQLKSKAFEKVENTLKMIENSEKLLRLMNFDNDSLFDDSYCYLNEVK